MIECCSSPEEGAAFFDMVLLVQTMILYVASQQVTLPTRESVSVYTKYCTRSCTLYVRHATALLMGTRVSNKFRVPWHIAFLISYFYLHIFLNAEAHFLSQDVNVAKYVSIFF